MAHSGDINGATIVVAIIFLLLYLALIGWVYSDAEASGQSGCLWAILVWLFNIWALAIYLIFVRGVGARTEHHSISRNEDFSYRAQARQNSNQAFGDKSPTADPKYYDPELDRMIDGGSYNEARSYLKDMQKMAREMNDAKAIANYAQYERRIAAASAANPNRGGSRGSGSTFNPR